jgi:nucleoside-diphosphate-sugar epimerase
MRILIAGCGYVGLQLGARLVNDGHVVAGIRRPGGDPAPMRERGIEPLHADLSNLEELKRLPSGWDWVVASAAPSEGGEAAYRSVYRDGARNLVSWLGTMPPKALVFTGSTGVYPQNDGSEVDETGATDAVGGTGRILREAEDVLLDAVPGGFPAIVLRIAGIYGPGRNRLAAMARGESRMSGDGSRWMNMVHRDDLVAAIVAALERGKPGRIYNVSDGAPCTEADFYGWLAARLGTPSVGTKSPASGESSVATGKRVRGGTNKRVVALRIRRELGWSPCFPDFRSGYEEEIQRWERSGAGLDPAAAG